jgi:hypothetical protein
LSRRDPGALMAMEVGMHSPWTSRFLKEQGHRVLVAKPRKPAHPTAVKPPAEIRRRGVFHWRQ